MEIFSQLFNALPGSISQGLIWGIMAIGVYITYRILDVADLTVDGSFATGGAVAVMLILNGCNLWLAMLVAFIAGLLAGAITGLLHTFMGIPAILAGILTQLSLYSINLKIMGKANQSVNVNQTELLVSLRWVKEFAFHNPLITVGLVLAIMIAALYWFFGTEMGCALRATGSNLNMSRAQGINTNFNKVLGIMLSNGLVAFSGAFLAQYQGFADVKMGQGAIVIGLAAVIIGEALFGKIFKNFALRLLSVAFGSIIYYIVIQAVITMGLDANLLKLLSAAIVAIFLAVPYWKKQYSQNHIRKVKGGSKNA
ncbi:MAG: ABC transporter permease [Ruminococcus sp.]|nr:ABC transporter permease [Ruminococcus sp.]